MNPTPAEKLYTPEILGLAVELADFPMLPDPDILGQARSQTCGSSLEFSAKLDADGSVAGLGMQVQACAIGQASAAIFARGAIGRTRNDLVATLDEIEDWLAGGDSPNWPSIAALEAARAHPARHGAITLAWKAALNALGS